MKRVILITGTPCTGKTTLAKHLTTNLDALHINLTEFANKHHLILKQDPHRKTAIINETKMRKKITQTINTTHKPNIIIDGHYAAAIVPKHLATHTFVLRRNPIELRRLMEKRGYTGTKLWENLASEILDICLIEALHKQKKETVYELDTTHKTTKNLTNKITTILNKHKKSTTPNVDWLGMLEKKGILDEYLKI
jgi:adenylate kinase